MGARDLPSHRLPMGATLDSSPSYSYLGLSPFHAGRILSATYLQGPFHSPSPRHPASRVNSQGPTCFNRPCPQSHPTPAHPISHPLHPLSCTCAMLNACTASTPHLLSVLGRSLQSLHIHFITTWEAKSRPSQAHVPQCLCLCSARSLPGPGGNICTPVAAVSKKREKKSSNFSYVVAINSYAYLQAFFEEFTYSLRF